MSSRETGRPYHHGSLPETLVAHAVELLDEAGPEAVVVREVARRAGVSPAAPFRHFADRAALMTAVTEAVAVDFSGIQRAAVESADDLPFRALGTAFVHYALTYPHRFALLRAAVFGATRAPALEAGHRAFTEAVTDLIVAGQRRGDLRAADPRLVRVTAQALVYGLSQMFVDGYLDPTDADTLITETIALFGLGVLPETHPARPT
ncbi:TetR/AcrR family transcriptional regulator [Actinocorallia sp. API 0066]|uniref:TetR/AcrR family transcriptional regulator n=1 Tax=Actinocorallia sp. API 0066 TaxID=2896846 RepID=UPI001E3288A1|nr:TetR/AcrR family transcriptional regulator [Actinocorallia sp. API 0066]MCD0453308.1 TetR/AcrR family transcriptional regulator [Actinocorallia sp. API 0066]